MDHVKRLSAGKLAAGLALAMLAESVLLTLVGYVGGRMPPDINPLLAILGLFVTLAVPGYPIGLAWAILQLGDPRLRKRDWARSGALAGVVTGMVMVLFAMIVVAIKKEPPDDLPVAALVIVVFSALAGVLTALIAHAITLGLQPRPG